jgi:hypothetical protein
VVIVAIDISDVQDEAAIWEDGQDHPRRRNPPPIPRIEPTLKSFLGSYLLGTRSIYRMIRTRLFGNQQTKPIRDTFRSAFTWRDWNEIEPGDKNEQVLIYNRIGYQPLGVRGGLAKIRERLATISSIAHENKSDLWILIYPWPAQLEHPSTIFDWEKFNVDMCHDIQCRGVINTFPRFRSFTGSNDWYEKLFIHGDVHFNQFGNQVIADEILATVK